MRRTPPVELLAAVRNAARQDQFLDVIPAAEARSRFEAAIDFTPLPLETVDLADALERVLAADLEAPTDVPAFDRSGVDGFAVRAADTAGAADRAPRQLVLNAEVIACGHPPALEVGPGTATTIATGGAIPRGADAVMMVEHTELVETQAGPAIEFRRAVGPGQFVVVCRLRHRPRRDGAAARPAHRLARDRHARRLRLCRSAGAAAAAGGGAFDRRRTGLARRAAAARGGL